MVTEVEAEWRREDSGGLILCGGLSSRMGTEKARLRFPGGTLLERVLERLRGVAAPVTLSLSAGQAVPALPPGVLTVRDSAARQGPLQGLLDGFRSLEGRCARVVVMAVDLPFFSREWMARLLDGLDGTPPHRACLYEWDGFANALTAAYDMALLPKLERLVAEGLRRPMFLSRDEPTRIIRVPPAGEADGAGHPLTDVDTPEAYRAALLWEGVGVPGGAEITVELPAEPGWGGADARGFAALHADTAAQALEMIRRLYPELPPPHEHPDPALDAPPDAAWGLVRGNGEQGPESPALQTTESLLAPETRLRPGDRLTVFRRF